MANPFGGSDEPLSKNTGHTNQANLIFALVPRSTTKVREVINGVDVTPAGGSGNYDADGYLRSTSGTLLTADYTIASPRSAGQATTTIVGLRYNSGGTGSGSAMIVGMVNSADYGTTGVSRHLIRPYVYSRVLYPFVRDAAGIDATMSNADPGADTCGAWVKGSDAVPSYSSSARASGVGNTSLGSSTNPNLSTTDASLDRLSIRVTSKWACQFVFVYDTVLSDADIEAIIDNPAGVLNVGTVGATGTSTATLPGVSGSAAGYLAQIAAPTSDAAVGSWQTTGANLFSVLDEYPANDADYIFTFTKLSPCRIKLGTLTDPVSSVGHKMYYRIKGDGSATMTVKLYTGGSSTVGTGTLVKTWTHAPAPSGLTDYEQTLSGGEADAITDYANLYLEFEAS
jgi:hypothetical protein